MATEDAENKMDNYIESQEAENSDPQTQTDEGEELSFLKQPTKAAEACGTFRLDISAGFGMCKCGHPKSAHVAKQENRAKMMLSSLKAKNSSVEHDDDDLTGGGDGPCKKFRLDTTATVFGACRCGFLRKDHVTKTENKAAQALRKLRSSNVDKLKDIAVSEDGPCAKYRVNVSANGFGFCHCGYKKEDHVAKDKNAAAKMLENLKKKNEDRNNREEKEAQGIFEQKVPDVPENPVETLTAQEENAVGQGKKKKKKNKQKNCVIS